MVKALTLKQVSISTLKLAFTPTIMSAKIWRKASIPNIHRQKIKTKTPILNVSVLEPSNSKRAKAAN